jgi:hypothetical protein
MRAEYMIVDLQKMAARQRSSMSAAVSHNRKLPANSNPAKPVAIRLFCHHHGSSIATRAFGHGTCDQVEA